MLARETTRLRLPLVGSHATVIPEPIAAAPVPARAAEIDPVCSSDRAWDPLLIAVAAYLLTAVGRVHQLFPALEIVRPATLAGLIAIVLYTTDGHPGRRLRDVLAGPTKCIAAFLAWMTLSVPGALVVGTSVDVVFGNFVKTVIMYVVVAGAIRGARDIE